MYEILLWDIDGTLMDFSKAERKALWESLESFSIEPTETMIKHYSRINQTYWKRLEKGEISKEEVLIGRFRQFLEEIQMNVDPGQMLSRYEENLGHAWFIQDDSLELCKQLKTKGFKQYAVTNGWYTVQRTKLAESGFDRVMDGVFISDEIGASKPQKAFFESCFLALFGTKKPSEQERGKVLIIGDSKTSDIQGGINAGIDTCWYNNNKRKEEEEIPFDYQIKNLWELESIIF